MSATAAGVKIHKNLQLKMLNRVLNEQFNIKAKQRARALSDLNCTKYTTERKLEKYYIYCIMYYIADT